MTLTSRQDRTVVVDDTAPSTSIRFQIPGLFGAPPLGSTGRFGPGPSRRPTDPTPNYDTLGWDTVYAVKAPQVNEAFARAGAIPTAFADTFLGSLATVTISGVFGAWSITPGGSGSLINLLVPFASGTAEVQAANGDHSYPLDGGSVEIQVSLEYLAQTVTPWTVDVQTATRSSGTTTVVLAATPSEPLAVGQVIVQAGLQAVGTTTFDRQVTVSSVVSATSYQYTDAQPDDSATGGTASLPASVQNLYINKTPPPGTSAVSVIMNASSPAVPGLTDPEILSLIADAFGDYFNGHLDVIDAVFNSVNVNMTADNGAFAWLMPTSVGYGYYDTNDNNIQDAIFAVLAMVQQDDESANAFQVAPGAIPGGADAGLSVGPAAFYTNIVIPSLPAAIAAGGGPAIDTSYFALGSDRTSVVNTKNVPMKSVSVEGTSYNPEIIDLDITMNDDMLQIYTKVHVPIVPGIDTYAESTCYLTISVTPTDGGGQTLAFTQAKPPVQDHYTEVATWVHITEAIIVLIGIILAALAAVAMPGALGIVAGIVIALIAGIAALVPEIIAWVAGDGSGKRVGDLGVLVTEFSKPYVWPGASSFTVTSSGINGVWQLGGSLSTA